MPSVPNVIMVLADQHHAGLMGCAGHPQARTPHLDAFAAGGVRLNQAHCQNPICTPSRVSILSGQYCHNHGYYGLSGPSNPGLDNLFRHFRRAGYRTAGFGKLHLPLHPRSWIADDVDVFGDAYDSIDGRIGDSDFLRALEEKGLRHLEDSWHNPHEYGPGTISHDARPSLLPYEETLEMWCLWQAQRFIAASGETPFCVQIAFQKPHHPLLPQQEFWDLYPEDVDLPPTVDQDPAHRPPHFRAAWQRFHQRDWDYEAEYGGGKEGGRRRAWRGTLACVSQIDDVFGRLLAYLEENGLAENTIVVYGADHGCYHGIHGIEEKAPGICSDAVCRVPMLWRVPDMTPVGAIQAGQVRDALVQNIDIAPTLAALCGLEPMPGVDGKDISGILQGTVEKVHDEVVTENVYSKAIRWGQWRLVHYSRHHFDGRDVGELYDMETDSDETQNLYTDPAYQDIVQEGRRRLLDWLSRTTRITNGQPVVIEGGGTLLEGRPEFPIHTDGRAPNTAQPHTRPYNTNYL